MVSTRSKVRIISGKSPAIFGKELVLMKDLLEISTLIPDMAALRDWIVSCNCHHVAMESTCIYWQPIYEIFEDAYSGDITDDTLAIPVQIPKFTDLLIRNETAIEKSCA